MVNVGRAPSRPSPPLPNPAAGTGAGYTVGLSRTTCWTFTAKPYEILPRATRLH